MRTVILCVAALSYFLSSVAANASFECQLVNKQLNDALKTRDQTQIAVARDFVRLNCGPEADRQREQMRAALQQQQEQNDEAVGEALGAFLTGVVGGIGAGATRIPHAAPAGGFVRPSVAAPRMMPVAHTSPTYIPRTTAGQTAVRPVAVPGATTTSGVAASNQKQGCSGLHASMMNSAAYYQTNPGAQAADLARYNSLCGQ
jgi:hypothetical protein